MATPKRTRRPIPGTTPSTVQPTAFVAHIVPTVQTTKRGANQDAAYGHLYYLNRARIVEILEEVGRGLRIPRRRTSYYQTLVLEACALASQDILESMDEFEIGQSARYEQTRRQLEKQFTD